MKAPAFQFYPKQWLGDDKVMAMSWDARAMHMHLICIAWQQDPPCTLPDDDAMLRRWLGNPRGWESLKRQIFAAWKLIDGRWVQTGLLEQFGRQAAYRESRKRGADARWGTHAYASSNECITDALQSTSSTTSTRKTKKQKPSQGAKPPRVVDPRFGDFKKNFEAYFQEANQIPATWDGREGSALKVWLAANPTIDVAQWRKILYWRLKSQGVAQATRLSSWIDVAIGWLKGPADNWGKPITGGNNGKRNTAVEREAANFAFLQPDLSGEQADSRPDHGGDGAPADSEGEGPKRLNPGSVDRATELF
jgi:hypothetical protein